MTLKRELYKVEIEGLVPIKTTYKVWATSPEEALDLAKTKDLVNTKPNLNRMKKIKGVVYKWLYSTILHKKNY